MKELNIHLNNVTNKMLSYNLNIRKHLQPIIGSTHDFGKYSLYVQDKLQNRIDKGKLSNHSLISAMATYGLVTERNYSKKDALISFMCVFFHHTDLRDIVITSKDEEIIEQVIKEMTNNQLVVNEIKKSPNCYEALFLLNKNLDKYLWNLQVQLSQPEMTMEDFVEFMVLFSMLINSDKEDAADYNFTNKYSLLLPEDVDRYVLDKFNNIKNKTAMDYLRNQMYFEVISNYEKVKDISEHFYGLNEPTGFGKSISGLSIATRMCKDFNLDKIIYSVPLTGVTDQTYATYEDILKKSGKYHDYAICKHHHLSEIKGIDENSDDEEILHNLFRVEGWDANLVCTTIYQLLNTFFGTQNDALRKLVNLRNSVIIIDESQGINPKYITFLNKFISILAKKLNIYFLNMTATKTYFLNGKELAGEKYFKLDILNRTKLIINKKPMNLAQFINHIKVKTNALVTVNEIPRCKAVYKALKKKYPNIPVFCLNREVPPYARKKILSIVKDKLKNREPVILVTTQIVEAGMDLDFDYGYREFCPLDSLIQWLGRLNRNGRNNIGIGEVCFIIDSNYSIIYNEVLLNITKNIIMKYDEIEEKQYFYIIQDYYKEVERNIGKMEDILINAIKKLQFENGIKLFQIFDNNYEQVSIFINDSDASQKALDKYINYCSAYYPDIAKRKAEWYKIRKEVSEHIINAKLKFADLVDDKQLLDKHHWSYISLPNKNYNIEYGFEEE